MLLAALLLFAIAVLVGWFGAVRLSWLGQIAAAVLLVIDGALALAGRQSRLPLDVMGGMGNASLRVDALSGLFLVISFGVAVPVLMTSASRGLAQRARLCALTAFTLLAVDLIITADGLFVLLAGWEALGFAFYLLAGFDRDRPGRARSSVLAVSFSKASGGALLLGGLLLAGQNHSFLLADWGSAPDGVLRDFAYALLLFGFGVKVGLVPMHVWLPTSYASAPGPARAIMAGIAVNVGFYGMWRVLGVLGEPPVWLACVVLVVAGITAILGISHSAVHAKLGHLIAWSSVENAGLITAGFGIGLVGSIAHSTQLVAAGLLAASAQIVAHALGKSLLFASASVVEQASGTMDLDRVRGVVRRLPFAGVGLIVGSLTLAGVPLTAGFASEWFTLEALMQQFRADNLALQLCTATAGVLVALTIGVAGIAFVRVIAFTAFGHPSSPLLRGGASLDRSWAHRTGSVLLMLGCLGAAVVAPLEVQMIAQGLTPVAGSATFNAVVDPWILQPVFDKFSALSPTWLWIVIPGYSALIGLLVLTFSGRLLLRVRRVSPWTSASPGVDGGRGYTSFGYANPIRKVLAGLLMTRSELRREEAETDGQVGREATGTAGVRLGYTVDVIDIVEQYLYRPLLAAGKRLVHVAKKLQSGRLDAYMAYMLIAVVAVLAIVTAIAPQ